MGSELPSCVSKTSRKHARIKPKNDRTQRMPRAVQLALRLPRARTQEPPWGRWAVDSGVAHCGVHGECEGVFLSAKGKFRPTWAHTVENVGAKRATWDMRRRKAKQAFLLYGGSKPLSWMADFSRGGRTARSKAKRGRGL